MEKNDKIYFTPGDIVILNKELDECPRMLVVRKEKMNIMNNKGDDKTIFVGIRCRWFNKNLDLCEGIFDSKDLELIK